MLPTSTKILIVGAGPTGVCAAVALLTRGVPAEDITIVDSVLEGENTSRAIVIHAATLEVRISIRLYRLQQRSG